MCCLNVCVKNLLQNLVTKRNNYPNIFFFGFSSLKMLNKRFNCDYNFVYAVFIAAISKCLVRILNVLWCHCNTIILLCMKRNKNQNLKEEIYVYNIALWLFVDYVSFDNLRYDDSLLCAKCTPFKSQNLWWLWRAVIFSFEFEEL